MCFRDADGVRDLRGEMGPAAGAVGNFLAFVLLQVIYMHDVQYPLSTVFCDREIKAILQST